MKRPPDGNAVVNIAWLMIVYRFVTLTLKVAHRLDRSCCFISFGLQDNRPVCLVD